MSDTGDAEDAADSRWQALRQTIEVLRPLLLTQGSLVCKHQVGRVRWCLRYYEEQDGVRTQRTLYVGDDARAERVQALLEDIQAPGAYLQETLRLANVACHVVRALRNAP